MRELQGAGFTSGEVNDWYLNQRKSMDQAGFGSGEIDQHFGIFERDMSRVQKYVEDKLCPTRSGATAGRTSAAYRARGRSADEHTRSDRSRQ
jgi:hypothetical protein